MNAVVIKCSTFGSAKGFGFQIGLLYIASFINRVSGHRVHYYDMQLDDDYSHLAEFIQANDVALAGITCNSHERHSAYDLAKRLRRDFADLKIAVGGAHHTIVREFPRNVPVDFYVFNDGEISLLKILDHLEAGNHDFSDIQDIAFLSETAYCLNPLQTVKKDIDDISLIDWSLLKRAEDYQLTLPIKGEPEIVPLLSSRGCPFDCSFCAARLMNFRTIRWMSPRVFVDELEKVLQTFPGKMVFIYDDHFLLKSKRLNAIHEEVRARGIEFQWGAYTRADAVDEQKIKIAREMGCRMLSFGFESGSNRVLKLMNKRITSSQQIRALRIVKKHGIVTRCSLILNFPGETLVDVLRTVVTLLRAGVKGSETIVANKVILFPGTAVFEKLRDTFLPADFSWERKYPDLPAYKDVPIYDSWLIRVRTRLKRLILKAHRLLTG
ncbi:MAG: B12-binding domain-containing radical SAM protein [Pirellulales bacterium]|nr:B12-binding domain-containing radical SAM protein [Pirellulales bacterium]